MTSQQSFPYVWRVRKWLPWLTGRRCRMVARGTMNAGLFEFECGYRVIASRNSIRRAASTWPATAAPMRLRKRHKYRAVKCTVDGHTFPSKREARRYRELALLAQVGEILNLELQPKWDLHAWGNREKKACTYIADFRYVVAATGETVVEDAKGAKTRMYLLKKKWLLLEHGVTVVEV